MADENTPNDSISSQSDRDTSQPRQQGRRPLPSSPTVPNHPHQLGRQPVSGSSGLRHPHESMPPPAVRDEEHSEESEQAQQPPPAAAAAAQEQPYAFGGHERRVTCSVCMATDGQCHVPALQNVLEVMEVITLRQSAFTRNSQFHFPDYHPRYANFLASQQRDLMGVVEALRHVVGDLRMRHHPTPREEHGGGGVLRRDSRNLQVLGP